VSVKWFLLGGAASVALLFGGGCGDMSGPTAEGNDTANVDSSGRITITDRTGKVWDVTHAVNEYEFEASAFQFGIGPNAIPPVFDPLLVASGEAGFPASSDGFFVLGANIDGDERAYGISPLSRHEIINEVFGEAHLTVGY
jgi:hypothetical protein